MASTATPILRRSLKNVFIGSADVILNTYATGGIGVTPAQLGVERVDHAIIVEKSSSGGGGSANSFAYNTSTQKIMAYTASNSESTSASNFTPVTLNVVAFQFGG